MPRKRRVVLPDHPHHILHRGHNRQAVFKQEGDYSKYLADINELRHAFEVDVYAWCLLPNEVHLLVNPGERTSAMGDFMKSLAARMTRFRNAREGRRGTLWESRYRSSPVQVRWQLACNRFIDALPVREGVVTHAKDYRWSSYAARVGLGGQHIVQPDRPPEWLTLGATDELRREAYAEYVEATPDPEETEHIRKAVERNQLTGDEDFGDEVERLIGERVSNRGRGRPKKKS